MSLVSTAVTSSITHRCILCVVFFLMIRRPPRSTLDRSSAASDVYKRQDQYSRGAVDIIKLLNSQNAAIAANEAAANAVYDLSLIHISEPTRPY